MNVIIATLWSLTLILNVMNYFSDVEPSWLQVFVYNIVTVYLAWGIVFELI